MSMSLTIWSLLKEHAGTILGLLPRMIKKLFTRKHDRIFEVNAVPWFRCVIQPAVWQLEAILAYARDRDYGYSAWDRRCGKIPSLLDHSEDPDTVRHFMRRNPAISRQIDLVRKDSAHLTEELAEASEGMKTWKNFRDFVGRTVAAYNADQAGRKARNWSGPDLDPGQLSMELTRILLHDPTHLSKGTIYDDFHAVHGPSYKAFLDLPWLHDRIKSIDAARLRLIQHGHPLLSELQDMADRVRDNHSLEAPKPGKAEEDNLEWESSGTLF